MCFAIPNRSDDRYYRWVEVMSVKDAAEVLVSYWRLGTLVPTWLCGEARLKLMMDAI